MKEIMQEKESKSCSDLRPERNYGIDFLRLFAMYLVTILHVLGQGGILGTAQGKQYMISWLLEITAYCAVNCFAIVSGYVSYTDKEKPYRYSKYLTMWLQVVFYSFGINLVYYIFRPEVVSIGGLVNALRPVTTSHYWYFTAYTGVFFMAPWMNKLIRVCTKKEATQFVFILFLLFSCYANYASLTGDVFRMNNGYSFLWLAVLYIVGAWMKKCCIAEKISNKKTVLCLMACIFLTWYMRVFRESNVLINYNSPTILLCAVSYVILFSKMKIGDSGKKLIVFFAPAAFGVYLIHVQETVWTQIMSWRFAWCAGVSIWLLPILVLVNAALVFVICLGIEKVRLIIFGYFKINERVEKLARFIASKCIRFLK